MKLAPYEVTVPEGRESEGYVYLRHNAQYTIELTNYGARCDAAVWIDGLQVGVWRVPPCTTVSIERPVHDTGRFTFYEIGTPEAHKAGISQSDQLGLLTVVFTPEWVDWGPLCASPTARSGGTGLSGESSQRFRDADSIEHDESRSVTIHLRLVGEPEEPRPMFQRETAVPPPVEPRRDSPAREQAAENKVGLKNPQTQRLAHKGGVKQPQKGMKRSDQIILIVTLLAVVGLVRFLHYSLTVSPRQEAEKMKAASDLSVKIMQDAQQKELDKIIEGSNKNIEALFDGEKQKIWIAKTQSDMAEIKKQLDESKARLGAALSSSRATNLSPNRPQISESTLDQVSTASAPAIFDSTGHSKSNGIRFRISCPSSWKAAEGTRPHIIQKFTSPTSHESFMIQVLPVPSELPDTLKKEDLDEIYNDEFYREFIPAGGRLLSSSRTKLDGEDCGMFESIYTTERAGIQIVQRTLNFILITKKGFLVLVGAAMAQPNETPSAEQRFEKAKMQFVGIAGTLHLSDKWLQR